MAFSEEVVKKAWDRAGGRCECTRSIHGHTGRCNTPLSWENRGRDTACGSWEIRHRVSIQSGGTDDLSNCEILCWNCHSKTL
jgi:5-methylcytosine-specific restriction endonuclease McrA